jgi:biopolymer transport protein ExbD
MAVSADANECDPNMTPLLDVVLQLIMFFMITVNFVRVESLTDKVVLPVAETAIPSEKSGEAWIYLNVGKDGKIIRAGMDDLGLDDEDGRKEFRVFLKKSAEEIEFSAHRRGHEGEVLMTIILSAHEDAREGQIFQILDSCQKAGFKHWKIRALTRES